ncbi:hybrid sensor histidine kinase/response regulator, partial [Streptomyces cavourensis]
PPAATAPRWRQPRGARAGAGGRGKRAFMASAGRQSLASACNPASICRAVRMAQDGEEGGEQDPDGARPRRLGLRVLVVEDNAINQLILQEQLEHLGCTVTLASDGGQALRRWDAERFDLVLTDLNMPIVNGFELARSLRDGGYAGPLIGLTSSSAAEVAQRALAAGMSQVLSKPLPFMALAQTLHGIAKELK